MDNYLAPTIDNYIKAAILMVEAHKNTESMEDAIKLFRQQRPEFDPRFLRLIWIGINAKSRANS